MDQPVTIQILLWVIGASVPVLIANFALTRRSRGAMHEQINALSLKVAENYATVKSMSDMEKRLVTHLTRIEEKVDWRNGGNP